MATARITDRPLSPQAVIESVKNPRAGCVVTYVGLIRDSSRGKPVLSVEYTDTDGEAESRLLAIAAEIQQRFPVEDVAIWHRTGFLKVGDINLVVAVAAGHRGEGFDAAQYAIDRFKESLPTSRRETYTDGGVWSGD